MWIKSKMFINKLNINPENFGQLGPLFVPVDNTPALEMHKVLKPIQSSNKKIIKDLEMQAAQLDQGRGVRLLGSWGLYSLLGFFKSLALLAIFLLLMIAGAMGRWWPIMIPPVLLFRKSCQQTNLVVFSLTDH